ncbi:MAG: TonB-dependent receptor [Sphingomicrobium sp.]
MTKSRSSRRFTRNILLRAMLLGSSSIVLISAPVPAAAQTTTATVRGHVNDSAGAAVANTVVTAVNEGTSQRITATTGPDGSYALTGLRPAPYRITASIGGATVERRVVVEVGQSATLDLAPDAPVEGTADAVATSGDTIVVTGTRLAETKTSEVATNISRQQIENLPQNNRNFLNFGALAPGVRVSNNETRRAFAGGGIGTDPNGESTSSPQVNVFIDGVSLKSNIQQGGIVGQDASRGNPFSQLAIQEFRVLTSNFKAEYEDAGTAIITAVTKSGTNEFHSQAFVNYQDERLIERDFFQKKFDQDKVDLKRYQFGAALGGPIIQDRVFFFVNYEGNLQDRTVNVNPGGSPERQAQVPFPVQDFADTFGAPFRDHLGFAKLNWQISDNQDLELSASIRKERDLRDFGGENSIERATDIENDTKTAKLRHQFDGNSFSNDAMVDFLRADLQFGSAAGDSFGRNFFGVIRVGGRSGFQKIRQQGLTFRDTVTFKSFEWNGDHLIKAGAKLSLQKYKVLNSQNSNPEFNFDIRADQNIDFRQPFEVNFGGGDPEITAKTTQIGLFVQDDWAVNDHLIVNLGLRWDYDSNTKNNKFVTPARAVAALRALALDPRIQPSFFDVEDYISTGDNRDADLDQFQPRIGFSYDLNADQRTVFFGGYGRYYDRVIFRNAAEETLLTQFRRGNLQFSRDGLPRNNQQTILFDSAFLTPEGFQALLDRLAADPTSPGTDELRLIPNDLKSPYTDQFSIGVRQRFGVLRTSLTYNYIRGKNQVGYAPLNRSIATNADGFRDIIRLINGYDRAVAAFNTRGTRYHGVYVTVDKPYTQATGWGGGIAYTFSRSKGRGTEFNFDFPNIGDQPFVPNAGDERHRLVANAIVNLPFDFKLSGLATYGSGAPFAVVDASQGFGPRDIRFPGNIGNIPHFFQVDLRLQKDFKITGDHVFTLSAEVFNLFDRANFGGADGFIARLPEINSNFGIPNGLAGPPRSFQFGVSTRF